MSDLDGARDRDGRSPREWLVRALGAAFPLVELRRPPTFDDGTLELRCGITLAAKHELLPLQTSTVAAVALDMCLPSIPALDPLFSELRRILRPTGTFAALVPASPNWSPAEFRAWRPLHRALGGRPRFVHEAARDHLHWLVAAADFAVLVDVRRAFRLPVPDPEYAKRLVDGLVAAGVWPADVAPDRLDRAREALARYAGRGRTLPIPLRLLVARR